MRVGVVQLSSSDDPQRNTDIVRQELETLAQSGAEFVATPEVSNCVSSSRTHQKAVLRHEEDDPFLKMCRYEAVRLGIWVSIGSIALKTSDPDERFANRSFLIDPSGAIVAWYDKIHMFDVEISTGETYMESAGYRPGNRAVTAEIDGVGIGLSICYDLRFPHLYERLAQSGAAIILIPSAFSTVTGTAHWHSLIRARAIETGAFVIAAAQTGQHVASRGKARETYGHSLVVSPWGEVLLDAGNETGCHMVDLDLAKVEDARRRIPSLKHHVPFEGPE